MREDDSNHGGKQIHSINDRFLKSVVDAMLVMAIAKKGYAPDVHLARVDLHNAGTRLLIWMGELDLAIQTA